MTPSMKQFDKLHILGLPGLGIPAAAPRLARDGGPYTFRNKTANFNVFYENGLGDNGPVLADGVLASCEAEYAQLQGLFGGIVPAGLPMSVYVVAGDFGAYHATCAATEMHCAAFDGSNVDLVRMLVVAEEVEVFSAAQGGWNCGASTGEGLSRVLATLLYPSQLNGFTSAASWLDTPDRPDFVNNTDPTDQNYVSIGCAVLYLNWLQTQLGFSWSQIIAAGGPTLAATYTNLTGNPDGLTPFATLLAGAFAVGTPSGVTTDNPFPL